MRRPARFAERSALVAWSDAARGYAAATFTPGRDWLDAVTDLMQRIYREFDLRSVVRVDIRADEAGKLHVLEANPKPDLKRPAPGVTSLVALGLPEQGMDYHDLIRGLLADRLYEILTRQPETLEHICGRRV